MISKRTIAHVQSEQMAAAPERASYFWFQDGAWVSMTNGEALEQTNELGMGLRSLGLQHGDRVAVMSDSRYEWDLADGGALGIGAVVVSIYPTSTQEQTSYILQHSGSRVLFLENASLWPVVAPQLAQLPELEHVVIMDAEGMPTGDWLSLAQLRERGRELLTEQPDLPNELREAVQPTDLAALVYTSGTTGVPKGVALKHDMLFNVIEVLDNAVAFEAGETGIVYLPMSHILQRVNLYFARYAGIIPYFAPAITEFVATCHAANPRSFSGVPRVFEKIHAGIMARVEQGPPESQGMFRKAMEVGRKRTQLLEAGLPVPPVLQQHYEQFDQHIFKKLRTSIFGTNIEFLTSGAAPISTELLEFYYAIGLPIYEGYGLTETSSPITLNLPDNHRISSVGQVLPGSSVKIAEDGEILLKGPSVFESYYKNPEATAAAFTEDGWFKSGDIGELDEDGFLRITDRKKFLIITSAGKNIPPAPIEQKLLQHPLIGQVVVHGDKRKYLTALFTLDPETLAVWAQQHGKAGATTAELAQDPSLLAEIDSFVQSVNAQLARYETIKQFRILPEEFSIANGLLTPTMKVKRGVIEKAFVGVLDEMYLAT